MENPFRTACISASLVLVSFASADVDCGASGPTVTVPAGSYGPAFSQEGGAAACEAVLAGLGLDDQCEDCETDGCYRDTAWRGGDAPTCDANQLPGVQPPTWIATVQAGSDKQGWITCSHCPEPPQEL